MFPAGHILGSAQVRFEEAGRSLLYTGDFKRRASATARTAESPASNVLLMETTFGLPVFRFPPREEIERRLVAACREALEEGKTPILLAYALGKSQEAAAILTSAGIPTVLHGAAWKLTPEYAAAGTSLPLSRPYEEGPPRPGEALIVPPPAPARPSWTRSSSGASSISPAGRFARPRRRISPPTSAFRCRTTPTSSELLAHVEEVGGGSVLTMHGYAGDFARILSNRGVPAVPLAEAAERRSEDA